MLDFLYKLLMGAIVPGKGLFRLFLLCSESTGFPLGWGSGQFEIH